MKLDDFNIEWVPSTQQYWIEDFLIRHGHEQFGFSSIPGSSARKGIGCYHAHYIQGHIHKANVIHVGNQHFNFIGVENPCLCELDPSFMKGAAQWQLGWTVVEKDNENRWQVRQTVL